MFTPPLFTAKQPIRFKIITPQGILLDKDVDLVTVTTSQGRIGLLHGRLPFVASLLSGAIHYHVGGRVHYLTTSGGIIYAQPHLLKIISDRVQINEGLTGLNTTG